MNMLYLRFALLLVMAICIVGVAIGLGNSPGRHLSHEPAACEQPALATCAEPDKRLRAFVREAGQARPNDGEHRSRNLAVRRILPGVPR